MLWLLLLPFGLVFGVILGLVALPFVILLVPFALLIWLPFMLLRLVFKLALGLILLPFIIVAGLIGLVIGGIALVGAVLLPLMPLLVIGACVWAVWRLASGPARSYPV